MKYLCICTADELWDTLSKLASDRVARIPLENVKEGTEYWVAENGKAAFVVRLICGRYFIDNLRIYAAGYRSKRSKPSIKYRTISGCQTSLPMDKAVYAAFIQPIDVSKRLPQRLKKWNIDDCSLSNLYTEEELNNCFLVKLGTYSAMYKNKFQRVVEILTFKYGKPMQYAQDIVADAFLYLCSQREEIKNPLGLWIYLATKGLSYRCNSWNFVPIDELDDNVV